MTYGYQVLEKESKCVSIVLALKRQKAPVFRPRIFANSL